MRNAHDVLRGRLPVPLRTSPRTVERAPLVSAFFWKSMFIDQAARKLGRNGTRPGQIHPRVSSRLRPLVGLGFMVQFHAWDQPPVPTPASSSEHPASAQRTLPAGGFDEVTDEVAR